MSASVIDQEGLPRPDVSLQEASDLARDLFDVDVTSIKELGSQQDRNFLVSDGGQRWLLKVSNPAFSSDEIAAQNAAMERFVAAGLNAPVPVSSHAGIPVHTTSIAGRDHCVRLLTFVDGTPLIDRQYLSPTVLGALGRTLAEASTVLAGLEHPGLDRALQWDLRVGEEVVADLLHFVRDPHKRDLLESALSRLTKRLRPLRDELPVQAIHGDITDDNVVFYIDEAGLPRIVGIIDFGDTMYSWRVSELAVACASVFNHASGEPLALLPLIEAFNDILPLTEAEITALWPLIVLRGAVLAVSGEQQIAIDPENGYASSAIDREWECFNVPASFDWDVAEACIRSAVGKPKTSAEQSPQRVQPMLRTQAVTVNLGWDSDSFSEGSWLEGPRQERYILDRHLLDAEVVLTRYGEARLTLATSHREFEAANVALAVEVHARNRQGIYAPFAGSATLDPQTEVVTLIGPKDTIILQGLVEVAHSPGRATTVNAGDLLGLIGSTGTTVWRTHGGRESANLHPPRFVRASEFCGYTALYKDPAQLLVAAQVVSASEMSKTGDAAQSVLERRRDAYNPLQGYYYNTPPRIERGWKEHLIDTNGRHYLDMVNNVSVLGHGNPAIASAAYRQWSRLNTNSRFNYNAVAEFSERLLAKVPTNLDTVFLVNSGTEAVDLALRLSKAFTKREDVLCCEESYHGWSLAADAVSTSTSDNPQAAQSRPAWVHVVDAPNDYRGTHRGEGAGARYAEDAARLLHQLERSGKPIGAFIAEPRNGNAGAIGTPRGYLNAMYATIRDHGGVCIADEVQVGYGRLGSHFWGFEEHGAEPDIITMAKAMGNGHPLGAVITRREIADALADQGDFFSSSGGSTLSSRIGLTVLDVIESDNLQANAAAVGQILTDGFRELMTKHDIIGNAHGKGLYQGLEFVRDRVTLVPAAEETRAICDRMLELGIIVLPTGDRQNILKIKPPLCFTAESARFFLRMLDKVLTEGW